MSLISRIWGLCPSSAGDFSHLFSALHAAWNSRLVPFDSSATYGRHFGVAHACSGASMNRCHAVVDGYFGGQSAGQNPAQLLITHYRQKGFPAAFEDLRGDFAWALHDTDNDSFWLARDRLGVRPLYFALPPGGLAFSSQPLPLTGLIGDRAEPDSRFVAVYAASHYRLFDNLPEQSPYVGVKQLPAAHYLHWQSGTATLLPYWQLRDQGNLHESTEDLAAQYREILSQAVSERLALVRNPLFSLSGGMDSSSVLATAVQLTGQKQAAISTVYEDSTYDESGEIGTILDHAVHTWHRVLIGQPEVFKLIREMVAIHDEPVATATWLSHFLLCQQARQTGADAVFTGLGGDELNAGEYEHFFFHFADLFHQGETAQLQHEINCWAHHHDHPIHRKTTSIAHDGIARLTDPIIPGRCLPDLRRQARYQSVLKPGSINLLSLEPVMDVVFDSYLKNRCFQDIFRETAPCCLRAQDRHGFHYQLPHLNPFYDHRIVEFMFRIPGNLKIRDGVTKYLLRQAMRGILPESTRTRIKKTGWNAPAHLWFSRNNSNLLMKNLQSPSVAEHVLLEMSVIERLLNEHEAIVLESRPVDNHMMLFWQLANLAEWFEQFTQRSRP